MILDPQNVFFYFVIFLAIIFSFLICHCAALLRGRLDWVWVASWIRVLKPCSSSVYCGWAIVQSTLLGNSTPSNSWRANQWYGLDCLMQEVLGSPSQWNLNFIFFFHSKGANFHWIMAQTLMLAQVYHQINLYIMLLIASCSFLRIHLTTH